MTKISQLPSDTNPISNDLIAIVDVTNSVTKKIPVSTLLQTGGLIAQNGLNAELKEKSTATAFSGRINNGTATRSTAGTAVADVPGTPSITVTAGTRAIKIHCHLIMMGVQSSGIGQTFINVNSTNRPAGMYFDAAHWQTQHIYEIIDVAAGATAVIKAQWTSTVAGGLIICNATGDAAFPEFINGWVQVV